jgi:hypothetical protein
MNPSDGEDFRYWAFTSYSHADAKWGDWLHAVLETYRVPVDWFETPHRKAPCRSECFPYFAIAKS